MDQDGAGAGDMIWLYLLLIGDGVRRLLIAPAIECAHLWDHPATQRNSQLFAR